MARKTIFVSDFTEKDIADEKQAVTISLRFGDARKGVIVADGHIDDPLVKEITKKGRQQARRGRRASAPPAAA